MSNNGNSSGSVLLAFMVGALAGAAVALLYAPAAGTDTRRKLAQKAREGRDTLEAVVERGREAYEQARKEMA
jgi:gas vesicle protein